MTRFFFPDPEELKKSKHDGLASIPVLFDPDYRIHEAENRYLRERALMEWPLPEGRNARPREGGLADTTILSIARRLQHFADWRHRRPERLRPLGEITYDHVLSYEREQRLGQGDYRGRSISHRTAAMRADVATDFLLWAAHHKLRKPFPLVVGGRATTPWSKDSGSAAPGVAGRSGAGDVAALTRIPSRPEIKLWLEAVLAQRGVPKNLICRVMVETGIRLMEAVALQTWQWPTLVQVKQARARDLDEVDLFLVVTKYSKARTVKVPIDLAMTVAHWVETGRPELAEAYKNRDRQGRETSRLFLSDARNGKGVPIQRHTVFDCFHEVEPRPAGWHPHMARHAFACHFMFEELRMGVDSETKVGVDRWIEHSGIVAAQKLRLLLGHKQFETTSIYLDYLRLNTRIAIQADDWHEWINGGDE